MKELPRFTGDHPLVTDLNRLVECIRERTPIASPDCPIAFEPRGFKPMPKPPGTTAAGKVEQFRVARVHKDHLLCNTYRIDEAGNETIGTEDVQIAKPFELRATPWHEQTVGIYSYEYNQNGINADDQKNPWDERSVTDTGEIPLTSCHPAITGSGITILEKIWPNYIPNKSIIYAAKVEEKPIVTHAEVLVSAGPPEIYSEDVSCDYVDLNVDGRKWEMPWRKVAICVENADGTSSRKFVLIRTSCPWM